MKQNRNKREFIVPKEPENNSVKMAEDHKDNNILSSQINQINQSPYMNLLYPHASPYIFTNQKSPGMPEFSLFRQSSGSTPYLPYCVEGKIQSNWKLFDNQRLEDDKEKPAPEFDGEIKEEYSDDENSDKSMKEEQPVHYSNARLPFSPGFSNDLRYNLLFSPQPFAEDKVCIIKPIAVHPVPTNPLSTPKISTNDEVKLVSFEPKKPIEEEDAKVQIEIIDSSKYELIDSIYPQGGKIKVLKRHLFRILSVRKLKGRQPNGEETTTPITRMRTDQPAYESRSKFATKRPRDYNGRFFTKEGYEEYLKEKYIEAIVSYVSENVVPGIKMQDVKGKSYEELLPMFPQKVFKIEHFKSRKTNSQV